MNSRTHAETPTYTYTHTYQTKTLSGGMGERTFPNGGRFGLLAMNVYGMSGEMVSGGKFSRFKPSTGGGFLVEDNSGYYTGIGH